MAQQIANSGGEPFFGGINPSRGRYASRFMTAAELAPKQQPAGGSVGARG